jgi:hypothetical protein
MHCNVATEHSESSKHVSNAELSDLSSLPPSTRWYRAHGRPSRREKAQRQQYLTPAEEKALVSYLSRMSENGFPIPVKYLRSLAQVILRQRFSIFQSPAHET